MVATSISPAVLLLEIVSTIEWWCHDRGGGVGWGWGLWDRSVNHEQSSRIRHDLMRCVKLSHSVRQIAFVAFVSSYFLTVWWSFTVSRRSIRPCGWWNRSLFSHRARDNRQNKMSMSINVFPCNSFDVLLFKSSLRKSIILLQITCRRRCAVGFMSAVKCEWGLSPLFPHLRS
jgi:hypothetical protein